MGGGERVAIHSMLAAVGKGHEVTLLSEEFDTNKFEDFFGCDGLFEKVGRISYPEFKPSLGSSGMLYRRLFYYQKEFRRVLSHEKPFDLVLGTQDVGYVPSVDSPVIQYCYFPEYFRHLEFKPHSPIWRLYYLPARAFYRERSKRIAEFLAVSDYTSEFVRKVWGRGSKTLYPPCPVELYKSWNGSKEDLAITVGRIVPEKRMHLLSHIATKLPGVRFVIVGSVASKTDGYYKSLERNAPSNLSIVLSPLRKAREIVSKAKIYVHCARSEHFGITIVEAMAAGCVPVVHNSGGPREIVTDEVGFRWENTEEAVQQMRKLIKEPELQTRLSKESAKRSLIFSNEAFEAALIDDLKKYA